MPKEIFLQRKSDLLALSNQLESKPQIVVSRRISELKNIADNLKVNTHKFLVFQRGCLGHFDSVCRLMNPVNLLKKGFAIIYYRDKIVGGCEAVPTGAEIKVRMADAALTATIKTKIKTTTDGNEFDL